MSAPHLPRTDPADVVAVDVDHPGPVNHSPTGNGRRVPTRYRVRYVTARGARWRRVYVMSYGHGGTPYVVVDGRWRVLDSSTEARLITARGGRA